MELAPPTNQRKLRFQEIHRLYKLHFGNLMNKKEGGCQGISDIKIHLEILSSTILGKEKNVSKIISMKNNSSEFENKNETIDQFKEIKEFCKKAKHHKVLNSKSNKNTTPRRNDSKSIVLKIPKTSLETFYRLSRGTGNNNKEIDQSNKKEYRSKI